MDKKRIFVGVDISDEARRAAAAHIDDLRSKFRDVRVGWERPEKLHLTLKFVGDVDNAILPDLTASISEIASRHAFLDLALKGTGVFPSNKKPRILWLGVTGEASALQRIQTGIEHEFEKFGIAAEKREFNPHLTIGRIREPERARALADSHSAAEFEPVTFRVTEIVTFESKLLPSGSVYQTVARAQLSKS